MRLDGGEEGDGWLLEGRRWRGWMVAHLGEL